MKPIQSSPKTNAFVGATCLDLARDQGDKSTMSSSPCRGSLGLIIKYWYHLLMTNSLPWKMAHRNRWFTYYKW